MIKTAACALVALAMMPAASASQYLAYSSHTESSCSSTPKQVAFVASSDCSTSTASTCVADSTSGLYLSTGCVTNPTTHTNTLFGSKPWILFDIYEPNGACTSAVSSIGYSADGSCLVVDGQSSSLTAAIHSNKSASVVTYSGASCSGSPIKSHLIGASDLQATNCVAGLFFVSTSKDTTTVVDTNSNDAQVQSISAAALMVLTAATVCVA